MTAFRRKTNEVIKTFQREPSIPHINLAIWIYTLDMVTTVWVEYPD